MTLRDNVRHFYYGSSPALLRWRFLYMAFDLLLVVFFLATTFVEHDPLPRWVLMADYLIGGVLAVDWGLRLWAARNKLDYALTPIAILDFVVVLSLLAPAFMESFVFLRIVRTLRLARSYHVLRELRENSRFFREREEVIFAALNLLVFIFVISAAVYALQVRVNPQISNYLDALYFTITTLTTTGFGDITLNDTVGRMLAVLIMVVGVSLFLRLLQSIFRPRKVRFECPDCGLQRHDPDAVHCKHCGLLLHIRSEGD